MNGVLSFKKIKKCGETKFCLELPEIEKIGDDGGLSGGSGVRRPGSEDPHRC